MENVCYQLSIMNKIFMAFKIIKLLEVPLYVLKSSKYIYPQQEMCMNIQRNIICNNPKWIQTKCSSTNEWMNKMWHIHIVEYYLAMKKNEVLLYTTNVDGP